MASGVLSKDLQEYFDRAESWDARAADEARKAKRNAYIVAAAGVTVGVCSLALYLVSPLRIVEPYVIRVDERFGAVDVVSAARDTEVITGDEAVRKYFLAEYVRVRETWVPKAADEFYRKTVAMTSTNAVTRLRAERDPANPASPAQLYRNGQTASVTIRGVSFVSDKVGQVRFSRFVDSGGPKPERSDWLATVEFDFAAKPTNDATRFYNPLGFVVVNYRVDSELSGGQL